LKATRRDAPLLVAAVCCLLAAPDPIGASSRGDAMTVRIIPDQR